jgi:DNA-binding MltR family transcriptional regulator
MASALKKILRAKSTKEDVQRALKELETDGPRGTVVLGHALIEDAVRSAIAHHMRPLNDGDFDQLFRGTSPLASLSAMTRVAYAFKIIGAKTKNDIDRLREVRNAFAHAQAILTFESKEVLEQLKLFECLKKMTENERSRMDGRRLFRTVIRFYLIYFLGKLNPDIGSKAANMMIGFDD